MNNTSQEPSDSDQDYADYPTLLTTAEGTTWCAAYVITAVAIVIGNLLVVVVFARSKSFQRKKFWLLVNLAVADLLVGGVAVPLDVYTMFPEYFALWLPGDAFLDVHNAAVFFVTFTPFASILNLAMISLERCYATFFAFRYRQLKNWLFILALFLIWILAAAPYAVSLLYRAELVSALAYLYFRGLFTAFLLLVICLAYLCIWVKLKWGATPQKHRARTQNDRKLTVTLLVVTTLSLIAWLPLQVLSLVLFAKETAWHDGLVRVDLAVRLLLFSNSLVNPVLYTMRMPVFKAEVVKIWLAVTCRRNSKLNSHDNRRRNARAVAS